MSIRTAADIHRLQYTFPDTRPPALVTTALEYRRSLAQYRRGASVTASATSPDVYVDGWKWCVVCAVCDNRPMYGWAIACCFECGTVYEGLTLPVNAEEIETILARRPKLSQRSWLPGETLEQLLAENAELGVE